MSRISKDVAGRVATKMTQKSYDLYVKLEKEFKDAVRAEYLRQIPDPVMNIFKTHSEYIDTTSQVRLDGKGFNRMYVNINPCLPTTTNSPHVDITVKAADKLIQMKNKYEHAKVKYNTLREELEGTLISLGTHKRIRESLPEASEFLPPPMSNALIVDVSNLQKRLKMQDKLEKV